MKRAALVVCLLVTAACTEEVADPPSPRKRVAPSSRGRVRDVCRDVDRLVLRVQRGYTGRSSPDISVIPREPNYVGSAGSPVHSGPWDYLAEVPLVVHGPGHVKPGRYKGFTSMVDVAPTMTRLIGFDEVFGRGGVRPGTGRFDGRPLDEALVRDARPPKLVLAIVWDGGGWNALREHPRSWPFLRSLMKNSASFTGFEIGSSPSVTPPIHTTLSTGVYPRRHGIPGLRLRRAEGEYVDPFIGLDPSNIKVDTLADLWDASTNNRAVTGVVASVNWHLSMMGQGAGIPGGDRDPVLLLNEFGNTVTNELLYELPAVANADALQEAERATDASDGKMDGAWMGHPLDDDSVRYASPAHVRYEQYLLERVMETEGFGRDRISDLLYVNFKPSDDAGHKWGMTSEETGEAIRAQDDALKQLVRFLDQSVGEREWVLFLTADHGQTPYPEESGAWPIAGGELQRDTNTEFDRNDNQVLLSDRVSSPGMFLDRAELKANDVTLEEVAEWIARYTVEENLKAGDGLPRTFEGREDEPLFVATLAGRKLAATSCD